MSNEFSTTTAGTTNLPPAPRYDESVAFLRRWLPDGPWALTSVVPDDRTSIQTRTFYPKDEDAVRRWLADNGSHRNVYFSVNPTSRDLSKKAERVDIKSLIALHVDIDPRAGEDVDAEQARALSLLTDKLPQGVPPPSLVIFSGGGYQGFWRLTEPLQLDGTLPCADEAKRWNLQLELLFGADHCHNIDRIMRLPGTVNRPDSKKRAKGRKEALATVHSWSDATYPLAAFTKAPQVQVSGRGDSVGSVGTTQRVKVSGNLKKFNGDVNLVPTASGKRISDRGRVVIVQGKDPDEPNKYGDSRSEWLFFACCEMVRAGVSNDDIYAVITDPNFGISDSVLDKGSGVEKYALRQIERARADVGSEPARVRLPGGTHQHADTARELAPLMRRRGWCRRGRAVFTLEPGGYLESVKPHRAVTEFEAVASFYRVATDSKTGTTKDVPDKLTSEVARIVMESADIFAALPEVKVIYETPVLVLRCGDLFPIVGFDEESGILTRGEAPPDVALTDAKRLLSDLLRDWRFRDDADCARAVAALIKPALNASAMLGAGRVPMDVVEADKSQAGKGLLCRVIAAVYRAKAATVAQMNGGGVGSVRESIAKNLLEGRPFIQLDNWRGALNEPFLEAALTEPQVECRAPHKGGAVVDPSGTCFLMTSNGAELTEDLANRCNVIRIVKQPDGYQFNAWSEGGIVEHVIANQPQYMGAVWAALREWHRLGRPLAEDDGSHDFRAWARATRYIVREVLGFGDPLDGNRELQREKSTPALVWLRAVKNEVQRVGRLGEMLRAADMLDLCLDVGIDVPGVSASDSSGLDDEAIRDKALRAIGVRLRPAFAGGDTLTIDGVAVRRVEKPRLGEPDRTDKWYVFGERPDGYTALRPEPEPVPPNLPF